jgi:hypothetical protein
MASLRTISVTGVVVCVGSLLACAAGSSVTTDAGSGPSGGDSGVTRDTGLSYGEASDAAIAVGSDGPAIEGGGPYEGGMLPEASADASTACPNTVLQCNGPTLCGPPVVTHEIVGSAPAARGGAVVPGLYFLTGVNVYRAQAGGPTPTYQISLQVGTSTFAETVNPPWAGTYSTSGTTLTRNLMCGGSGSTSRPYTATSASLLMYTSVPNDGVYEQIFTRQ